MTFNLTSLEGCISGMSAKDIQALTSLGFEVDGMFLKSRTIPIEINTIEELVALSVKLGSSLIVEFGSITIYNDYIE